MHADPPAWIFPVQACDSNYITFKQIQIIDILVAKFRKARDATIVLLQRYFQVSPKLLGFGEACPGVLKVSCCGVGVP